jgi:hypothetical protein
MKDKAPRNRCWTWSARADSNEIADSMEVLYRATSACIVTFICSVLAPATSILPKSALADLHSDAIYAASLSPDLTIGVARQPAVGGFPSASNAPCEGQ